MGWGVVPLSTEVPHLPTPTPDPSPQGGGEASAATSNLNLPCMPFMRSVAGNSGRCRVTAYDRVYMEPQGK